MIEGKRNQKQAGFEVKTFTVPFDLDEIKENIAITTNISTRVSKEQIINQIIKFQSGGNIKEAIKHYQQFINQGFKDFRVFCNYGVILHKIGKLKEAEFYQRKAIELNPNFAEGHANLGLILRGLGKIEEAELSQRKAIELNPNLAAAYSNLGNILMDLGKSKEAELSYRKAIELNPNLAEAYYNLFRNNEKLNNIRKLNECLEEFKNINIIENEVSLFRARLSYRNKDYQTAKKLIENISFQWIEQSNNNQKILYWSYKAFIEDKIQNYDVAYNCFKKSQDKSLYTKFNNDSYFNMIDKYKENISKKKVNYNNFNDEIDDSNLSFLLGFPRSGTTLLDTILRSHKDIQVIEEKPLISIIEKLVKENLNIKINNLNSIAEKDLITLRKTYFKLLRKYTNKEANVIIDKLPLNTIMLPLINLLFPNAKIIFTHRHPYDTVLSCFQQLFKPNEAMANFTSLKSSSKMYDKVMNAWDLYKINLPLDFITSKYEDLIDNFDIHTLKILDFLDLEWDKNIKNYRRTALDRGKINTPSSSQVVQPLYKSSIDKWRNYDKYFEECHQYLEKWISYFNY